MSCKHVRLALPTLFVLFIFSGFAAAQAPTDQGATSDFKAKLDALDSQLRAIDSRVNTLVKGVQSNGLITEKDLTDPEGIQAMKQYAEGMKAALEEAAKDAAGPSEAEAGQYGNLKAFDDLVKSHEKIFGAILSQTSQLTEGIKTGLIKIDPAAVKKATPSARDKLRKLLDPKALKQLEEQNPGLFKSGSLEILRSLAPRRHSQVSWLTGWLITPAHALIAGTCSVACGSGATPLCYTCAIGATSVAEEHWRGYQKCCREAKDSILGEALEIARCTAGFILILG